MLRGFARRQTDEETDSLNDSQKFPNENINMTLVLTDISDSVVAFASENVLNLNQDQINNILHRCNCNIMIVTFSYYTTHLWLFLEPTYLNLCKQCSHS